MFLRFLEDQINTQQFPCDNTNINIISFQSCASPTRRPDLENNQYNIFEHELPIPVWSINCGEGEGWPWQSQSCQLVLFCLSICFCQIVGLFFVGCSSVCHNWNLLCVSICHLVATITLQSRSSLTRVTIQNPMPAFYMLTLLENVVPVLLETQGSPWENVLTCLVLL